MPSFRFILAFAFIAAFGIHNASALEVENTGSNNAAVNLTDPDDKIPVAHIADDGTIQSGSKFNLQAQGSNSPAFGFSLTGPGSNSSPSAFERAQERFQQQYSVIPPSRRRCGNPAKAPWVRYNSSCAADAASGLFRYPCNGGDLKKPFSTHSANHP